MPTTATPKDIRDRWISNDQLPDDKVLQIWLDDAETLIVSEVPSVVDKLTDDPDGTWSRRVAWVQIQLVTQAMKNPDGVRQKSQTAGVFTEAITFGSETIMQAMTLTPAHKAILAGGGSRHTGIDMTVRAPDAPLANAWVNGPDQFAPRHRTVGEG